MSIIASPKLGASFVQYVGTALPGGGTIPPFAQEPGVEAFLYVMDGSGALTAATCEQKHALAPGGWTYDMLYGDSATAFQRWGLTHGAARALGGLGMLVEQAAESFRLWRGVRPDTRTVIERLTHLG